MQSSPQPIVVSSAPTKVKDQSGPLFDLCSPQTTKGFSSSTTTQNLSLSSPIVLDTMTTTRGMRARKATNDISPDTKRPRTSLTRKPLTTVSMSKANTVGGSNRPQRNETSLPPPLGKITHPPKRQGSSRKSTIPNLSEKENTDESRTPPPPKLDDHFRVFYDNVGDMFGKRPGASGWYFGKVQKVKKIKSEYKLDILFDDTSLDSLEYPSKTNDITIERVISSVDGPHQLIGELSGQFAGDLQPPVVDIGDLVFCNYQLSGQFFRGRIAAVDYEKRTCDVIYDDLEYEKNIPVGANHIIFVEDGQANRRWMHGLKLKFGTSNRKASSATIEILPGGDIELAHSNGQTVKQSYKEICYQLLEEARNRAKKVINFPLTFIVQAPTDNTKKATTFVRKTKTVAIGQTKRTIGSVLPQDFEVAAWLQSEDEVEEGSGEEAPGGKELNNSIKNTYWKAANTSESHVGYQLLTNMETLPNQDLLKDLIAVLWQGPLHKKSPFPDCVRMEHTSDYLCLLKARNMAEKLAKALPKNFVPDFLEQVQTLDVLYAVVGDEGRLSSAALQRTGQTLHVKNSGASLFFYVLQKQLRGVERLGKIVASNLQQEMIEFKTLLSERDLTCDILGVSGQTLKNAVRATFSVLIHYGHYLSGDFQFPKDAGKVPHATTADWSFVTTETRLLLKTMGRVCCLLAWLHSVNTETPLYETALLMRDVVQGSLSSSTFSPLIFLGGSGQGSKNSDDARLQRHWNDMKHRFCLSLDRRITGSLGKHTAVLLGIPPNYF